jgi:hypothetical protein
LTALPVPAFKRKKKKTQKTNDVSLTLLPIYIKEIPEPCGKRHHDVHGSQTKDDVKEAVIVNCSIALVPKDPLSTSSSAVIRPATYCRITWFSYD